MIVVIEKSGGVVELVSQGIETHNRSARAKTQDYTSHKCSSSELRIESLSEAGPH